MEKIEVIQEGTVTSCNIGVSKEEWLELLKDSATSKHYKEALIKVFYAPEHRGSCISICNKMGAILNRLTVILTNVENIFRKSLIDFRLSAQMENHAIG